MVEWLALESTRLPSPNLTHGVHHAPKIPSMNDSTNIEFTKHFQREEILQRLHPLDAQSCPIPWTR